MIPQYVFQSTPSALLPVRTENVARSHSLYHTLYTRNGILIGIRGTKIEVYHCVLVCFRAPMPRLPLMGRWVPSHTHCYNSIARRLTRETNTLLLAQQRLHQKLKACHRKLVSELLLDSG